MASRPYSRSSRERKRRPEDILGRSSVTHAVNYTMSNFLSAELERLYDEGLAEDGIKSKYFSRLVAALNKLCATKVRTGAIRVEELEQIELPLTSAYVRRMRMAKRFDEYIGEYVDWTIDAKYRSLEKAKKEEVAIPAKVEEQQPQPIAPQPWHGPRERPNPTYQRKRRGRSGRRSRRDDETFI